MKKKALALAALAVVLAAALISGSLAFFTAEDKATNTVTFGPVEIDIWENGKPTDSDRILFEKPLVPVTDPGKVTADPGYAVKKVQVKSTGRNAAYIRVHLAVPEALTEYLSLHTDPAETGWQHTGTSKTRPVDGVVYTVMTYDYRTAVPPGELTPALLLGAYLESDVDIQDDPATPEEDLVFCKPLGDGTYAFSGYPAHFRTGSGYTSNTLCILVAAEAMQDRGFPDAAAALNTGFGENTNPWQ